MTADELADLIAPGVAKALAEAQPDDALRLVASTAFSMAVDDIGGAGDGDVFVASMEQAITATAPDGTDEQVDRVAKVIATAAVNAATVAAAPPDSEFTWTTMQDDAVRDLHRPLHGEVRAAGEPFLVGDTPLLYPGQPVGDPENWMNCRCVLVPQPVTAGGESTVASDAGAASPSLATVTACSCESLTDSDEDLVARAFDTDKRKQMADRGTAMPDGSYPIANEEDLRNAIQAIGRAKNPDAVKAHIRKRAKALGLTDLLPDSWTASAQEEELTAWAKSTSPPGTHDGPGWLTNPRETQRLRNYWTKGAGARKIRWGSDGDLTRCAKYLGKYVGPQYAWGTCQNLHHTVFGEYNPESRGRRGGGDPDEIIDAIDAAFTAAAQLEDEMPDTITAPPAEWFADPGFDAATPLTITSDGRVLGHLAAWETCHVGITGECVKPPRSNTGYAHFRTGEVVTADGSTVPVGQITMDTGHAGKDQGPQDTVAHYDNTGTGVADVAAGEDEFGIWVAGAMRPGVSEQQMYALKATGALSGDWRRIGGNLELVAALAVNVPGFPVPRVEMAASVAGAPLSLVAAAVVTLDPNALDADRVAVAVLAHLDQREADKARRERASALQHQIASLRAAALTAAL